MNLEKYGKLTVLHEIVRPSGKRYGKTWVRCRCDCGNEKDVAIEKIKYGQVVSCGCTKKLRGSDHKDWKGCGEIGADFFSTYRRNAKEKEFTVTIEYIWKLFLKQGRRCAISGLELTFDPKGDGRKHKKTNRVTASLDRIDSSKGYIEGNVQWVHKHINVMKNEYPQKYFVEMCKLVAKNNT